VSIPEPKEDCSAGAQYLVWPSSFILRSFSGSFQPNPYLLSAPVCAEEILPFVSWGWAKASAGWMLCPWLFPGSARRKALTWEGSAAGLDLAAGRDSEHGTPWTVSGCGHF